MQQEFLKHYNRFFNPVKAMEYTASVHKLERYFTFDNFEKSSAYCATELRKSGLTDVSVESFPADGEASWSGWKIMKAWSVSHARLMMTYPEKLVLCDWQQVPHSLVMYSGNASAEAECVLWDGEDVDLSGKIPFTGKRINDVFPMMRRKGVQGMVSDFVGTLPGVRDPFDIPDSCRWENSGLRPGNGNFWGFMLTPAQGKMIREMLVRNTVILKAEIDAGCYNGHINSVTGIIQGTADNDEEVLLISHLYEPGANDNASGVGCGLEIARSLQEAIAGGKLARPARSIRFLFTWEGYGLIAWMEKHKNIIGMIKGGIDIDEIGVDQPKGHSTLHIFMPPAANPSCVGPLALYLCSKIMPQGFRMKSVADRAEIINDTLTSDPNIDIPMPCLIQYPASHYHVSSDTLDTISAEVMRDVGHVSACQLYILANPTQENGNWISGIVGEYWKNEMLQIHDEAISGKWPFSKKQTVEFLQMQFSMASESVVRFGLTEQGAAVVSRRLLSILKAKSDEWINLRDEINTASESVRLQQLILSRGTLGSPKAWGSFDLSPEEESHYRKILYGNNFDLLFHRICYWCDGNRSMAEIIKWLEIELYLVSRDSSISRTSSGSAIEGAPDVRIDREAMMYIVEKLISGGYLVRKSV